MTKDSLKLFLAYRKDAPNWGGTPLVGGNVGGEPADKGNLTHLKKLGLVTTFESDGDTWLDFTALGRAYEVDTPTASSEYGCTPSTKHPGLCAECGETMEIRAD